MKSSIIPENISGKPNDLNTSVTFLTPDDAQNCFSRAGIRLLAPAAWHKLCGPLSASFTLTDAGGIEVRRPARIGDYIRIDIPGPGTIAGDGYDWVKVEIIKEGSNPNEDEQTIGMRVRPCKNPQKTGLDIAHFFQGIATSTFIIRKKANTVTASYHGRNEIPNIDMNKTIDTIRNTIVTSGALAGLSEMQWKTLIRSFIEKED